MKKFLKISAVVVFFALLLLMKFMDIFDIPNVHELDKISFKEGSFKEVVVNDFFEETEGTEFYRVYVSSYMSRDDERELRSEDPLVIDEILARLNTMELESYNREILKNIFNIINPVESKRRRSSKLEYDSHIIRFSVPGTSENLVIHVNDDGENSDYILIERRILNKQEEKDKKIIHYETEKSYDIYKMTDNKIDMDYINMLLDSYDSSKE